MAVDVPFSELEYRGPFCAHGAVADLEAYLVTIPELSNFLTAVPSTSRDTTNKFLKELYIYWNNTVKAAAGNNYNALAVNLDNHFHQILFPFADYKNDDTQYSNETKDLKYFYVGQGNMTLKSMSLYYNNTLNNVNFADKTLPLAYTIYSTISGQDNTSYPTYVSIQGQYHDGTSYQGLYHDATGPWQGSHDASCHQGQALQATSQQGLATVIVNCTMFTQEIIVKTVDYATFANRYVIY